jgi:hypothetical protein
MHLTRDMSCAILYPSSGKTEYEMTVVYEWDVETIDLNGDIQDHDHRNTYAEVLSVSMRAPPVSGEKHAIVLVRDDDNGRSWAYMENGKLPEYFEDAYQQEVAKVPKRFHAEVARA